MWGLIYEGSYYRLFIKEQLDPVGFRIQTKRVISANAHTSGAYVSFSDESVVVRCNI